MKNIAVDYDDTYSACPEMFEAIMKTIKSYGHAVFIVSARKPSMVIPLPQWECFYTSGEKKADYMRSVGIDVDIWIDDWPELIGLSRPDLVD